MSDPGHGNDDAAAAAPTPAVDEQEQAGEPAAEPQAAAGASDATAAAESPAADTDGGHDAATDGNAAPAASQGEMEAPAQPPPREDGAGEATKGGGEGEATQVDAPASSAGGEEEGEGGPQAGTDAGADADAAADDAAPAETTAATTDDAAPPAGDEQQNSNAGSADAGTGAAGAEGGDTSKDDATAVAAGEAPPESSSGAPAAGAEQESGATGDAPTAVDEGDGPAEAEKEEEEGDETAAETPAAEADADAGGDASPEPTKGEDGAAEAAGAEAPAGDSAEAPEDEAPTDDAAADCGKGEDAGPGQTEGTTDAAAAPADEGKTGHDTDAVAPADGDADGGAAGGTADADAGVEGEAAGGSAPPGGDGEVGGEGGGVRPITSTDEARPTAPAGQEGAEGDGGADADADKQVPPPEGLPVTTLVVATPSEGLDHSPPTSPEGSAAQDSPGRRGLRGGSRLRPDGGYETLQVRTPLDDPLPRGQSAFGDETDSEGTYDPSPKHPATLSPRQQHAQSSYRAPTDSPQRKAQRTEMLEKFDWSVIGAERCVSEVVQEEQLFPVVAEGVLIYVPWDDMTYYQQRNVRLRDIQDEHLQILEASRRLQAWARGRQVRLELLRSRANCITHRTYSGYRARDALDRVAALEREYEKAKEFYDRMQARIAAMFKMWQQRQWYLKHKAELIVLRAQRLMLRDRRMRKARVKREVRELNHLIEFSSNSNEGALVSIFVPQQKMQVLPSGTAGASRSPLVFNPPRCAQQIPHHQQYHGQAPARPLVTAAGGSSGASHAPPPNPLRASTPFAAPPIQSRQTTPGLGLSQRSSSHDRKGASGRQSGIAGDAAAGGLSPGGASARSGAAGSTSAGAELDAKKRRIRDQASKVAMKRLVTRSRHPLLWVPEDGDTGGMIPPL